MLNKFTFNKTHKIILASVVSLLLLVMGFVSWAGGKAVEFIKDKAKTQSFLQGELKVGDVGASLSGEVWLSDIIWTDPKGNVVAKIPRVNISVRLSDVLGAKLDAGSVEKIILERPELNLTYNEKDGLNVVKLVNLKDDDEKDKEKTSKDKKTLFRGNFEIEKGTLSFVSGKNNLKFESFDSKINYKDFPIITGTLQAKENNADFVGNLKIDHTGDNAVIELNVDGRSISLKSFFDAIPVESSLKVHEGTITSLSTNFIVKEKEKLQIIAKGSFTGVKAEYSDIGVTASDFKGDFSGTQDKIVLSKTSGNVNGQPISVEGDIDISKEPYKPMLHVKSDGFKPGAIIPDFEMIESIAFNSTIEGTVEKPKFVGSFSTDLIKTEQLNLTNVQGNFVCDDGIALLDNVSGNMYGGSIKANGNIKLKDKGFTFNVNGSGIDSRSMTDTNLNGPLGFNAIIIGAGTTAGINATGDFIIRNGDFNGIPFKSLEGYFQKRGGVMTFSDVVLNTLAGSVKTTASVSTNGKIVFKDIDASQISKKTLEENIKSEVQKEADKINKALKKIF